MKKLFLVTVIGLIGLSVQPVFAQQNADPNESELYYVNVPVEKIYPYYKGYVVTYRSGVNKMGTAYIPIEWFRNDVHKAQLAQIGSGKNWPSMTVFYKEGAFHSVRLYVARHSSHETWGTISSDVNLDSRFEGVETLDIKF
jgi:hypothetical protein